MTLPALAADLPSRPVAKAPVAVPPPFTWTNCYVGVNAGGKWGNWSGDGLDAAAAAGSAFAAQVVSNSNNGGGMFGGQVGCQYQTGGFVLGLEGDFDGVNLKRSFVAGAGALFPFVPGDTVAFKNDWQASIRGRLGYAWDRWLLYATGGVAFADVKAAVSLVPTANAGPFVASVSNTATGGTVGLGVEYAILDNLSLGVEYRYSSFGHQHLAVGTVNGTTIALTANPSLSTNEVTARLNWHF
jgi:outer membrane immunogenic protein